jgi:hypothetical protein
MFSRRRSHSRRRYEFSFSSLGESSFQLVFQAHQMDAEMLLGCLLTVTTILALDLMQAKETKPT